MAIGDCRMGVGSRQRRVVIVVNPISGRRNLDRLVQDVCVQLRARGVEADVHRTTGPGEATRIAQGVEADARAMLVVGGDGTVREVVEGLINRAVPLVIVPAGTENLVARHFGMSAVPGRIVETVLRGAVARCDVGLINGRHFLIMVGVGFDAAVVAEMTRARAGHIGHLDWAGPIWRAFRRYGFPRIRVEVDGEQVFDDRGLLFAGVLPCYGGGLQILRGAVPDDGLLDVCILRCSSRLALLGQVIRLGRGRHVTHPSCIYLRCKNLCTTSPEPVLVQADGDPMGSLPVSLSVLPQAATFLVPE